MSDDATKSAFHGMFPQKRDRTTVETVVASQGFPVSHRKRAAPQPHQDDGGGDDDDKHNRSPQRTGKLLDWYETAHEVRRLGATAFVKKQKRDFRDEEYKLLTGRDRKKQKVPMPIVRGIRRKQAQREANAMAEARASGLVLPKQQKDTRKKKGASKEARLHGPAPSIGFVKKGVLQLKRKPT